VKHYRFIDEALREYEDAVEYYERESGLGDVFIREVDRVLDLTLQFPEMGSLVLNTPPELRVRRRLVRRFDVEIDYIVIDDELIILAIFHCKREPGYWHARLRRVR